MTAFADRPPSTQWEPASLPGRPDAPLWLWHKPGGSANELLVSIPPEVHAAMGPLVTARGLAAAAGLDGPALASWSAFGQTFESQGGGNPLLDQPLPPIPPAPGAPPAPVQVTFRLSDGRSEPSGPVVGAGSAHGAMPGDPRAAAAAIGAQTGWSVGPAALQRPTGPAQTAQTPAAAPLPKAGGTLDDAALKIMTTIESDWNAIIQLERNLSATTKQLNAMAAKLQSLNRDLAPHERVAADSNDVKDWTDARRFLRDRQAEVSRQVRAFDIGAVSQAGDRRALEDIVKTYVKPRVPFANMAAAAQQFEAHRKTCQNLLTQSGAALSKAQSDGEGKARQVLAKINAKMRKNRAKR